MRERNPDAIGKEVLFKKWLSLKETISKAYTRRATQNQIDSLNNELSAIEEKLIAQIPEFQHFNRQTARYQDVKQKLLPDEAAIEFVHFRYHNAQNWTDSILYGALIVRSNQKSPEFVYLCTEQALKSVLMNSKNPQQLYATRGKGRPKKEKPNTLRGNKTAQNDGDTEGVSEATVPAKALYNLIWQPLETYLKDTKTVYYAAGMNDLTATDSQGRVYNLLEEGRAVTELF